MKKKIILQEEISVMAVDYTKPTVTDNAIEKTVKAKFNLIDANNVQYDYPEIIVWQGDAYDAIGQWSDDDLKKEIEKIFSE